MAMNAGRCFCGMVSAWAMPPRGRAAGMLMDRRIAVSGVLPQTGQRAPSLNPSSHTQPFSALIGVSVAILQAGQFAGVNVEMRDAAVHKAGANIVRRASGADDFLKQLRIEHGARHKVAPAVERARLARKRTCDSGEMFLSSLRNCMAA